MPKIYEKVAISKLIYFKIFVRILLEKLKKSRHKIKFFSYLLFYTKRKTSYTRAYSISATFYSMLHGYFAQILKLW